MVDTLLVDHRELICKANGDFTAARAKHESCFEVGFCVISCAARNITWRGKLGATCAWERLGGFLSMAGEAAGAHSLPEGWRGQSCSPLSWLAAQGLASPKGNMSLTPPGTSRPRRWMKRTSPVRNTFSLALWKRIWDWEVIAVLGKAQLLCPGYHSQWLPYGVTAQWSRKCLRPNPAIPKEEDDALANVSRRLNGLSRGTIRKLTMPQAPQLSTFRKCLLQVRHPNATGLTGHQGAAYTTTSQL